MLNVLSAHLVIFALAEDHLGGAPYQNIDHCYRLEASDTTTERARSVSLKSDS